jgi:hypothetical protein
MDKDWTRPLMDELDRPVEVGRKYSDEDFFVCLSGRTTSYRSYRPNCKPKGCGLEGNLDYPQGTLRYADEPDHEGWYHYTPTVDGEGPDGVSVETHDIQARYLGEQGVAWFGRGKSKVVEWLPELTYRYRPLPDALTTLSDEDLTASIEAGKAAKAELDRREQAGKADEQAFREALANALTEACCASVGSVVRRGGVPALVASVMARFTLKKFEAALKANGGEALGHITGREFHPRVQEIVNGQGGDAARLIEGEF